MESQDINYQIEEKKYHLSFLGTSPRHDWTVIFILGLILVVVFSIVYYFDNESIRKEISTENLISEPKNSFEIEKAQKLLNDFEAKRNSVDQSL